MKCIVLYERFEYYRASSIFPWKRSTDILSSSFISNEIIKITKKKIPVNMVSRVLCTFWTAARSTRGIRKYRFNSKGTGSPNFDKIVVRLVWKFLYTE